MSNPETPDAAAVEPPGAVASHHEDAVAQRTARTAVLRTPAVQLPYLAHFDRRLQASLVGAMHAGERAELSAHQATLGQSFVGAVLAIERGETATVDAILRVAESQPAVARGLISACGWLSPQLLRGHANTLLQSTVPLRRWLGIAACAQHRVNPAAALDECIAHPHPLLRCMALRAAGQLGRIDLLGAISKQLDDNDPACRQAAAWSAVLLGDRSAGLQKLHAIALSAESNSSEALQLSLLAAEPDVSRALVRQLVAASAPVSTTLRAASWAGDVQVVPWLIKHMADDRNARLAGEAFSFITGANLVKLDLDRTGTPPADVPGEHVAYDDTLPWPDPDAVRAWWLRQARFLPHDVRCFSGAPVSQSICQAVLISAGQQQRYSAALLKSLTNPGTPLFNVAAPAHRQERLLNLPQSAQ